jgi:ABC-type branched-subunit amino acid transport system ATPase component
MNERHAPSDVIVGGIGASDSAERVCLFIDRVSKRFGGVAALQDASMRFPEGKVSAVIGPNGAGKTTLFSVISGFLQPDRGRIFLRREEITGLRPDLVVRKGVVRTFQDLYLCQQMTVLDNVLLGMQEQIGDSFLWAVLRPPAMHAQSRVHGGTAMALLEFVGLHDAASRLASQLSYGQQKLLSLARALATEKDVFLLDEPTAGVAPQMVDRIVEVITKIARDGKTVIMIEHNLDAVSAMAHGVWVMDAGRLVAAGTPDEMWNREDVMHTYLGI